MPSKVELGKLNTDGETLDADDDSREFLQDLIVQAPMVRSDNVEHIRPKNNAEDDCKRWFREVEIVSNEEGEEGVDYQEGRYGQVCL